MNNKVLKTLEFDKIIANLESITVSPMGKKMVAELMPYNHIDAINDKLAETTDATLMITKHGSLPLAGLKDISTILKRLLVGGNLSIIELLHIRDLLHVVSKVKSYANQNHETLSQLSIYRHFEELEPLKDLYKEITRCILSEEDLADDSSSQLFSIRRTIQSTHSKIRQQLNRIITSTGNKSMLQDAIITVKNDRFCVPVKAEYRGSFKGMIHEQSASGSTLFIEPMAVVELNNTLREQLALEKKEIERILASLSAQAHEHIDILAQNQEVISILDFIFAKGELSRRFKCSKPLFNTDKYINLKQARHPLLDQKTVVPTNIYLGKDFRTLVITGPNTGGKTVSLKTIGLLSLMGQSGLHIPAFDGSSLTVLDEIYADIGDEQSIEQSLSTFSSHMTNIIRILDGATDRSLVLFDELGAGTDPTEGAALAMAILNDLFNRHTLTVATTHYSELKVYALSTEGVENACQEFDVTTLRPTYKLLIGVPGKSNAFAISKRLGLDDYIIEASKKLLEGKAIRFEDLITELEVNKKSAIAEKEKATAYRIEAENAKKALEEQKERLNKQRESLIEEAKAEAYKILHEAKQEADSIIKDMHQMASKASKDHKALEGNRSKLRSSMSKLEAGLGKSKKKSSSVDPSQIKKGDTVFVSTFNQNGTVITPPNNKGELEVQLGIMKTKINISVVEQIEETAKKQKKQHTPRGSHKQPLKKSIGVSAEVDVRGTTSDEAIILVGKYLDDAYLAHLPTVTIIHGKGTGVLRQAIHTYLRRLSYIKSYRIGNFGEGESGVTIVEFK